MVIVDDFFMLSNTVLNISEEEYQKVDILIDVFDAISRTTCQSLYIIDYYRKNFLYVSSNPLFLCGHSSKEIQQLGYMFYIKYVPAQEQVMLTEINRAGFDFYNKIPITEKMSYMISYNFHLMNGKKKTLINHKLTPMRLSDDGKIWLAACVVSLSSRDRVGSIEIRKINQTTFWSYSTESHRWKEEIGITLNERERDILSLSTQGYTMTEIADKQFLSLDTIKFHRRKLFDKLDVKNITEALAFAANHKLI
jgi:DNA-binding CsgD family transcriptional regulator